jgi:hypothetical protein
MNFRYRWKNGAPPSKDEAIRNRYLLAEDQFTDPKDQQMAEEMARKQLGLPVQIPASERFIEGNNPLNGL